MLVCWRVLPRLIEIGVPLIFPFPSSWMCSVSPLMLPEFTDDPIIDEYNVYEVYDV